MRSLLRFVAVGATVALGSAPIHLSAQVPNAADVAEVRTQFGEDLDTLYTKFTALAKAIPADKYAWRPGPGVRSVGEVFMHVASEFYVYSPMAFGATPSPVVQRGQEAIKKFEAMSTKDDVLKHLDASHDYAKQALAGVDPSKLTGKTKLFGGNYNVIETTLGMTDDMHEHLGQLIAYARMNGIKPPWSK